MPRVFGQLATTATTDVPIEATAYAEQSAGAQRSLKSASANDTAAGTGVRKVRVFYFLCDANGAPIGNLLSEDVTLNGVTAVPMVETALCFVEKMEAIAVGSGGVAAGAISLYTDNAGVGSVIGSIASSDVRTRWAHHYVPTGKQCSLVDLSCIGGDAASALVQLKLASYASSGIPEQPLTEKIGTTATLPRDLQGLGLMVVGPARVRATVTPGNANNQTTYAGFGYVDRSA